MTDTTIDDGDPLYGEDFAAWLDVQVAALGERRLADLDLDNLIEAVESTRPRSSTAIWLPTNVYGFDRLEI